jgi:hypothetical protein
MKQNKNGYGLEKLKYDLKGTVARDSPPLVFSSIDPIWAPVLFTFFKILFQMRHVI